MKIDACVYKGLYKYMRRKYVEFKQWISEGILTFPMSPGDSHHPKLVQQ